MVANAGNVQVKIYNVGNPATPGTYTINVATSAETSAITSAAYTVAAAPPPTNISVYNAAGYFLGNTSTFGAGLTALIADGVTLKFDPGIYDLTASIGASYTITAKNVSLMPSTGNNTNTFIAQSSSPAWQLILNGDGDSIQNIAFTNISGLSTQAAATLTLGGGSATTVGAKATNVKVGSGSIQGAVNVAGTSNVVTGLNLVGNVAVTGDKFSITGSIISSSGATATTARTGITVNSAAMTAGTISGNAFTPNQNPPSLVPNVAIAVTNAAVNGLTISGNTFTGSAGGQGIVISAAAGTTTPIAIDGKNTFTGLESAIVISANAAVNIQNNTITSSMTNNNGSSINFWVGAIEIGAVAPTLNITGNTITNNAGYSIDINPGATVTNIFVTGNNFSANAKGFNNSVVANVSAIQNWWGDATGPKNATTNPAGKGDAVSDNVLYKPFSTASPTSTGSTVAAVATATNYDFSTTSGVQLLGLPVPVGTIIGTETLAGNPKAGYNPPFPAITGGYFDVYFSAAPTGPFQINFYASGLTSNVVVYYWSQLTGSWVACTTSGVAGTGNYAYVMVTGAAGTAPLFSDFTGTPFVLVQGPGATPPAFNITAPDLNSNQPLSKVSFTWAPVNNATSYEFIMSNNSSFTKPYTVDQTALTLPVYQYSGANLTAGTYYWRVIAFQGTTVIGNSQVGYFNAAAAATTTAPTSTVTSTATQTQTVSVTAPTVTTTAITVSTTSVVSTVVTTPTIVITTNPAPTITFTNQAPTVTTITIPPPEQTSPAWIWGIIGIGAVLIIVVIVLIVRTRRVV